MTADGDVLPLHQAPQDKSRIATLVYGGFAKCAYTYQKFQSDTERVLAVILERDARRWLRPLAGQFNIYYRRGNDQPEYVPDFVAAMPQVNLLIETKKAGRIFHPFKQVSFTLLFLDALQRLAPFSIQSSLFLELGANFGFDG